MEYQNLVKHLKSFIPTDQSKWNKNYGLGKFRRFLSLLGNPQDSLEFVHIGGTSGKGSTATFTASILTESGYKTGLHVSPDIITIRERMQIDGSCISKKKFVEIFEKIEPSINKMRRDYNIVPSYYEILLAMAFIHFQEEGCDLVVLEVGLGGKLDATNVIDCANQIITNIGLEHTQILGDTKELILRDKQEIIKQQSIVVSGIAEPALQKIIEQKALDTESDLCLLGKDFEIHNISKNSDNSNNFDLVTQGITFDNIKTGLPGLFQVENAALATMLTYKLSALYNKVTIDTIRLGIAKANIPGRFQIFSTTPLGIIDGAHNPDKISALVKSLQYFYPEKKFITIFRYKKRKDIDQSLTLLKKISDKIIMTRSNKSGDMGPDPVFDDIDIDYYKKDACYIFEPNLFKAYAFANNYAEVNSCGILVTGSLYMVNEFMKLTDND